jgi:hypothetical protein
MWHWHKSPLIWFTLRGLLVLRLYSGSGILYCIVHWYGHPLFWLYFGWAILYRIVHCFGCPLFWLYFGRGIMYCIVHWCGHPLFWLYFGRVTFCLTWISVHTLKNPFFLHLRGSQVFAAELLRSTWSPYHSRNSHFIWNLNVICRVKTNLSLTVPATSSVRLSLQSDSCLEVVRISFGWI